MGQSKDKAPMTKKISTILVTWVTEQKFGAFSTPSKFHAEQVAVLMRCEIKAGVCRDSFVVVVVFRTKQNLSDLIATVCYIDI